MNTHTVAGTALEAVTPDLGPATRPSGSWLPPALRLAAALDPQLWQRRAARGLTWHRNGRAFGRGYPGYAR